jgi:branched-chain amino acid transport system permease protein
MTFAAPLTRILALPALLLALAGCSKLDAPQASLCEHVARLLYGASGSIDQIESRADPSTPHQVVTALTLRAAGTSSERHAVACAFAGGAFSADRLRILSIATDGQPLDALHMMALRIVLEREGRGNSTAGATTTAPPRAVFVLPVDAGTLYFLQQLVNGLTLGCVIALIAIGYTLVYSIIGAINFAFGEIYMIGAFMAMTAIALFMLLGVGSLVVSLLMALPVAMALSAGYSWATERLVFRPLRQANRLMPLIAAIGLSIVLQNYVFVAEGANDLWLPPGGKGGIIVAEAGGFSLYVNHQQALLAVVTLVLAAASWYLLARTPFGRAQRASAQDKVMAALVGINIDRVIAGTFALGGGLAAAGGLMVASYYGGVNFVMGFLMGFKALTAAIVGGMGNFAGALLGGFIVALVETFWAGYLQIEYKDIAVFSLLIILLVFRPQGILGER